MKDITLIIPAKHEKESLPKVLEELREHELNTLIILEPDDHETIDSIKEFSSKIIYPEFLPSCNDSSWIPICKIFFIKAISIYNIIM